VNQEFMLGLTSIAFGAFIFGMILGLRRGYKRGRDAQWLDTFFATVERSKKKRDENGRFKKISFSN